MKRFSNLTHTAPAYEALCSKVRVLVAASLMGMALCSGVQADPGKQASRFAVRPA